MPVCKSVEPIKLPNLATFIVTRFVLNRAVASLSIVVKICIYVLSFKSINALNVGLYFFPNQTLIAFLFLLGISAIPLKTMFIYNGASFVQKKCLCAEIAQYHIVILTYFSYFITFCLDGLPFYFININFFLRINCSKGMNY